MKQFRSGVHGFHNSQNVNQLNLVLHPINVARTRAPVPPVHPYPYLPLPPPGVIPIIPNISRPPPPSPPPPMTNMGTGTVMLVHIPDGMSVRNVIAPGVHMQVLGSYLTTRPVEEAQTNDVPPPPPAPEIPVQMQLNLNELNLKPAPPVPPPGVHILHNNVPGQPVDQPPFYLQTVVINQMQPQHPQPLVIHPVSHQINNDVNGLGHSSANFNPDAQSFVPNFSYSCNPPEVDLGAEGGNAFNGGRVSEEFSTKLNPDAQSFYPSYFCNPIKVQFRALAGAEDMNRFNGESEEINEL